MSPVQAIEESTRELKAHNDTMDVIHAAREAFERNAHLIPAEADETAIRMLWQLAYTEGVQHGLERMSEGLERLTKVMA